MVPLVYAMNSGCSAGSGADATGAAVGSTSSDHVRSRPGVIGVTTSGNRSHTSMCRTATMPSTAWSTTAFIGTGRPPRSDALAVITTSQPASATRAATASTPNPLNTGTHTAPIFAQAISAATVSIAIGMKIATVSPSRTPSRASAAATPSTTRRSSA